MREEIFYYPYPDLSFSGNVKESIDFVNKFSAESLHSFADVLDAVNALRNLHDYLGFDSISKEEKGKIAQTLPNIETGVGRFLGSLDEKKLVEMLLSMKRRPEDAAYVLDKYRLFSKITDSSISSLLDGWNELFPCLLKKRNVVARFDSKLRDFFIAHPEFGYLLLEVYDIKAEKQNTEATIIPSSLLMAEKTSILLKYIELFPQNTEYIRLMINHKKTPESYDIPWNKKKDLKALIKKEESLIFSGPGAIVENFQTSVGIVPQTETKKYVRNGTQNTLTYDSKWIDDNLDFPTLLNNFIYLFELVDSEMRISAIDKPNSLDIFERYMSIHPKNYYGDNELFQFREETCLLQLEVYQNYLSGKGLSIEKLLSWFYKEYLSQSFGITGISFSAPIESDSYYHKCYIAVPKIEGILKRFYCYALDGFVDEEHVKSLEGQLKIGNYVSLLSKKHFYPIEKTDLQTASFFLFSDQSKIAFISKANAKDECFFDLIRHNAVTDDMPADYQRPLIDYLIQKSYIYRRDDGRLLPAGSALPFIAKDFFENGFMDYWHVSTQVQKELDSLLASGQVETDNALFSKQEQQYLNYYLNKDQVINGEDLRNEYAHDDGIEEPRKNQHDYYLILMVLILVTIRINDDLWLKKDLDSKQK